MTYLNYLEQTLNTPATNYHECALKRKRKAACLEFFKLPSVQELWADISKLEERIYELEIATNNWPYDSTPHIIDDEKQKESGSRTSSLNYLYTRIDLEKKKYALLKRQNNFSLEAESAQLTKTSEPQYSNSNNSGEQSLLEEKSLKNEMSGVEFLLSIAGMFSSETTERTSSDREDITAEILRKHQRNQQ